MKICRINFPLDKFLKVWYKYAHCKSELQKALLKIVDKNNLIVQ